MRYREGKSKADRADSLEIPTTTATTEDRTTIMNTKAQEAEKTEAIERLREILKPGDTVYTILRHVSSSGMSRVISVVKATEDGKIRDLDFLIAKLGTYKRTPASSRHDGLKVGGVGMDMGFAVVYDVSQTVFGDGYAIKQTWL